jgi:DNA invertase Pin-like site-specific DNA recombinase
MSNRDKDLKSYKYGIYARRSIEKRDEEERVSSIESQIYEMDELKDEFGLNIRGRYHEAHSAKVPSKRKEFNRMIKDIESGKINAILCWNLNRLSRNFQEAGLIQQLLVDGKIKVIHTPTRIYTGAENQLPFSVETSQASQFIQDLIASIKRGQRDAVRRGFRPSLAPLGYKNSKYREHGVAETTLIDEHVFPIIRKVFDTVLECQYTPSQVHEIAYKEWGLRTRKTRKFPQGKQITKSGWYKLLSNPFYYGRFEYPANSGNWYDGGHQKLISREEFEEVQKILGKDNARPKTHSFAYTGLIRCSGCGARITCEKKIKRQKNGNVHQYTYYRCTGMIDSDCIQKSVREDVLEEQFMEFLSSIKISPAFHKWAMTELEKEHEKEKLDKESIVYNQQREYDKVVTMLERLFQMRISGDIDSDKYQEEKKKLEEEQERLKSYLDSVNAKAQNWIHDARRLMKFCERAKYEFETGSQDKRRQIIAALGTEHTLTDRIVKLEIEKPFLVIQEMASTGDSNFERLEPLNNIVQQGYISQNTPYCELMWCILQKVRTFYEQNPDAD